jgi:hypothetical protein
MATAGPSPTAAWDCHRARVANTLGMAQHGDLFGLRRQFARGNV